MSLFEQYLRDSEAFIKNPTPELSRLQRSLKLALMLANVIFLIFACVLMGIGSVAYNQNVGPLAGTTIPLGIVVLGVFIMLLSFAGCLGSWRESRFLLGVYFLVLMLLTLLLFAVGIGVYVKQEQAGYYISQGWMAANNGVRVSFQNGYSCCGLINFNDSYAGNPCPSTLIPPVNSTATGSPCLSILVSTFQQSLTSLGGTGIAFAVFMFVIMIAVCYLIRGIQRKARVNIPTDTEQIHAGDDSANPTSVEAS